MMRMMFGSRKEESTVRKALMGFGIALCLSCGLAPVASAKPTVDPDPGAVEYCFGEPDLSDLYVGIDRNRLYPLSDVPHGSWTADDLVEGDSRESVIYLLNRSEYDFHIFVELEGLDVPELFTNSSTPLYFSINDSTEVVSPETGNVVEFDLGHIESNDRLLIPFTATLGWTDELTTPEGGTSGSYRFRILTYVDCVPGSPDGSDGSLRPNSDSPDETETGAQGSESETDIPAHEAGDTLQGTDSHDPRGAGSNSDRSNSAETTTPDGTTVTSEGLAWTGVNVGAAGLAFVFIVVGALLKRERSEKASG